MINHQSYLQYFEDIIKVYDLSNSLSVNKFDDNKMFEAIFKDHLLAKVKQAWIDYRANNRDIYQLTDQELDEVFSEATYEMTIKSISKLSSLGLVEALIKADGEITYSLTEKGQLVAESINQYL